MVELEICTQDRLTCGTVKLHFEERINIQVTCGEDTYIDQACTATTKIWTVQLTGIGIVLYCNGYKIEEHCEADLWKEDMNTWKLLEELQPDSSRTLKYRTRPTGIILDFPLHNLYQERRRQFDIA